MKLIQIRYLLQKNGKSKILASLNIDLPIYEFCPRPNQRFLFQWYSDHEHSYWQHLPVLTSSTTVGSRSTNTALGTCFPAPVSEKNVLKESSPEPTVLSEGICPSGWMPCSKQ